VIELVEVKHTDFELYLPLLHKFDPSVDIQSWNYLFSSRWETENQTIGYALLNDHTPVGFFAGIHSKRTIDGGKIKCVNMSTWVVLNEFRNHSLKLFFPFLRFPDHLITNLTASPDVQKILSSTGFNSEISDNHFIPWIPIWKKPSFEILHNDQDFIKYLTDEEMQLYRDHVDLACVFFYFKNETSGCFVIGRIRKDLKCLEIHFVSDPIFFARSYLVLVSNVAWKYKLLGFLIDARVSRNYKFRISIKMNRLQSIVYYKSNAFQRYPISDNLYTEKMFL
jgi:hypothetical protein